jgi:putative transposase
MAIRFFGDGDQCMAIRFFDDGVQCMAIRFFGDGVQCMAIRFFGDGDQCMAIRFFGDGDQCMAIRFFGDGDQCMVIRFFGDGDQCMAIRFFGDGDARHGISVAEYHTGMPCLASHPYLILNYGHRIPNLLKMINRERQYFLKSPIIIMIIYIFGAILSLLFFKSFFIFIMSYFFRERKSIRHQNWDYSGKGLYFVTLNTLNRAHYFGEIIDGKMQMSDIGMEVTRQWLLTPSIRPDMNIILDEFVVMPDHFHGIIGIGRNKFNRYGTKQSPENKNTEYTPPEVSCENEEKSGTRKSKFGPQRKNLGSIMRGFKSSITQWCRINDKEFNWQGNFHDRIIGDERHLNNIRNYIRKNPQNWKADKSK